MQFLTRKGSGPGPQDLIGKRRANSSGFGLGLGTFIWDLHGLAFPLLTRSPGPSTMARYRGIPVLLKQVKPLRSWTHWVEWSLPEWFGMAGNYGNCNLGRVDVLFFVFGWFGQIWASPITSMFIRPLWCWKICIPSGPHVKRLSERLDASSWDEDAPLWFRSESGHLQRAWWSGGWLCGTRRHGSLTVFVRVVSDSFSLSLSFSCCISRDEMNLRILSRPDPVLDRHPVRTSAFVRLHPVGGPEVYKTGAAAGQTLRRNHFSSVGSAVRNLA